MLLYLWFQGALFPASTGGWALNKGDPAADTFSRLDEANDFLGPDGVYHFRLCYPAQISPDDCYVFEQASDPTDASVGPAAAVPGFALRSHPAGWPNDNGDGNRLAGIRPCGGASGPYCWAKGMAHAADFFWTLGSKVVWNEGGNPTPTSFAGATRAAPLAGDRLMEATRVELYMILA